MNNGTQPLTPFAEIGEQLIQHIQNSNVFPSDALFDRTRSNEGSFLDADYVCIISWKLNTNKQKPNKRSRPIKLIIDNAALSDCRDLDKAKNNLTILLSEKLKSYNAEHDEFFPKEETWGVGTWALNGK